MLSRHADFRYSRNGALRFVCVDLCGVRVQASFSRCRKARTLPITGAILGAARLIGGAVAIMHAIHTFSF